MFTDKCPCPVISVILAEREKLDEADAGLERWIADIASAAAAKYAFRAPCCTFRLRRIPYNGRR